MSTKDSAALDTAATAETEETDEFPRTGVCGVCDDTGTTDDDVTCFVCIDWEQLEAEYVERTKELGVTGQ